MLKCISIQNLIKIYQRVQELRAFFLKKIPQPAEMMLTKSRHHFAYQWPDNLKMYKSVNIDQNMPCSERVVNLFPKRPLLAKVKLCEAISPFSYQWLDNVKTKLYAKFDPNIPCGLRVMSSFTK